MFIFYAKKFNSSRTGGRVVPVHCGRCGCEFFYELSRIGSGTGSAYYGIGARRAARSAEDRAQRDLEERLASESELVPCPKCNWINDEMVQGFRRGRYRSFDTAALIIGACGTAASLVIAWFLSLGPAADRGASRSVLIVGPAVSITLAIGMILLRGWLRKRIQPNRDYPFAPKIPLGSPPALLKDAASGKLVPAIPHPILDGAPVDSCEFQIGRHGLPSVCCECLQPATIEYGYKTASLVIPRCKECARASNWSYWKVFSIVTVCGLLLGTAILVPFKLESAEYWIFSFFALVLSLGIAAFVAWKVTWPVKVSISDGARGVVKLRFRHPEFARIVAQSLSESNQVN